MDSMDSMDHVLLVAYWDSIWTALQNARGALGAARLLRCLPCLRLWLATSAAVANYFDIMDSMDRRSPACGGGLSDMRGPRALRVLRALTPTLGAPGAGPPIVAPPGVGPPIIAGAGLTLALALALAGHVDAFLAEALTQASKASKQSKQSKQSKHT